jgi:hypothetical protein
MTLIEKSLPRHEHRCCGLVCLAQPETQTMPTTTVVAFLIDFAILLGSPDPTEQESTSQGFTLPSDAYRGCAVPANLCSELRKECSSADIALGTCKSFETTCRVDACGACDAAIEKCNSFDTHCEGLEELCDEALTGCGCEGASPKNTPVVGTCAPDQDMCTQLGVACVADGMDPEVCAGMADNVCPGARQLSCQAMQKVCLDEGGDCDNIFKTCTANLARPRRLRWASRCRGVSRRSRAHRSRN